MRFDGVREWGFFDLLLLVLLGCSATLLFLQRTRADEEVGSVAHVTSWAGEIRSFVCCPSQPPTEIDLSQPITPSSLHTV